MTTETLTRKYTIEEFIALPNDGNRYELVEGELVEMAGSNEEHSRLATNLEIELGYYVRRNQLGQVYNSDARYAVVAGSDTVRLPDLSFVQASRVTRKVGTMRFAPDLAVEVLSEGNGYKEIERKVREYYNAGGRLVWVIEPDAQEIFIYRVGSKQRETLTVNDELRGEDVIPGFKLAVSELFR